MYPRRVGPASNSEQREATMSPLSAWVNFYILVGTATGALIGLTFVVITLAAGRAGEAVRPGLSGGGLGAYNTPTVVHFAAVLLGCATLSAPWPEFVPAALPLGLDSLGGVAYVAVVARPLARWEVYKKAEDDAASARSEARADAAGTR